MKKLIPGTSQHIGAAVWDDDWKQGTFSTIINRHVCTSDTQIRFCLFCPADKYCVNVKSRLHFMLVLFLNHEPGVKMCSLRTHLWGCEQGCTSEFPHRWYLWLDTKSDIRRRQTETDRMRKGCLSYLRVGFNRSRRERKVQSEAGSNEGANTSGTSVSTQDRLAWP